MVEQRVYRRPELGEQQAGGGDARAAVASRGGIGWPAVILAVVLSMLQAGLTLYAVHRHQIYVTSTQISVVSFVLLFLLVLAVNPLLRVVRVVRPLRRVELLTIFAAMAVTAGISTFGLADQLIPLIATPSNPKWNTEQRGWDVDVIPFLDRRLYLQDEGQVVRFREGFDAEESLLTGVPWRAWAGPLFHWLGFIVAGYGLFYFLTLVLYPQWAAREKLIFPLAKIPEDLLPGDDRGGVPSSLRTAAFWIGFGIPFAIHLWNGSISAGWLQGVNQIKMVLPTEILKETAFEPLLGAFNLSIFFAVVGIAFLLPPEISFSVWFYFLVYNAMVFVACSLGFGKTGADFPIDWFWLSNFVTAQGGGAIVAFGTICLVKALLGYREDLRGGDGGVSVWPLVGLGASLLFMVWWMVAHMPGVGLLWAVLWVSVFVLLLTVITISLMRVVAECGFFGYQSWTGPFHFAKMLNLPHVAGGAVLAPLLTFYSILFLDIKTFIAPAIINAKKMEDSSGAPRFRFHLTVIVAMFAAVAVSLVGSILLGYRVGAQQMSSWFYSSYTPWLMDTGRKLIAWDESVASWHVVFVLVGGGWVGLSMLLRRAFFWFPHPIGYIMFVNPLVKGYWFSFFLAWVVKRVVLKYGGKHTFDRVKPLFIGLIVGEIMACAFWVFLTWALALTGVRIDLNRHG